MKNLLILTIGLLTFTPAFADYRVTTSENPMDDVIKSTARGPDAFPSTPYDFPYGETVGNVIYVCDDSGYNQLQFALSEGQLYKGDLFDSWTTQLYSALVRFPGQEKEGKWFEFNDEGQGVALFPYEYEHAEFLETMYKHGSVLMEITFIHRQKRFFEFDLVGLQDAITEARANCKFEKESKSKLKANNNRDSRGRN